MSIQSGFRPFRFVLAASLCLSVTALTLFGQSTGAIQGTVTDPSGAAVPNASVTVKDPSHGVDRTQATDSAGIYYIPSLPVGTYSIEVKAAGLSTSEAKGIVVDVGTTAKVDLTLTVASSTQVVEIQATAALADTTTASLTS